MNSELEKKIINALVIKQKAERVLYELSSKKRRECIWKFKSDLFTPEYRINADLSKAQILNMLCDNGAGEDCYVLSIDEEIDGKEMKLSEALDEVFGRGPALLSCIHGKLAYFECEQERGAPERLIIKTKGRL